VAHVVAGEDEGAVAGADQVVDVDDGGGRAGGVVGVGQDGGRPAAGDGAEVLRDQAAAGVAVDHLEEAVDDGDRRRGRDAGVGEGVAGVQVDLDGAAVADGDGRGVQDRADGPLDVEGAGLGPRHADERHHAYGRRAGVGVGPLQVQEVADPGGVIDPA